jgi:hypothetical protein
MSLTIVEIGSAEPVGQAEQRRVATDHVAEDRNLRVEGVDERLEAAGDRAQPGGDRCHVVGDEGAQVDIKVVVADSRLVESCRPREAHRVAKPGQCPSHPTASHLQFEVEFQIHHGIGECGLEET